CGEDVHKRFPRIGLAEASPAWLAIRTRCVCGNRCSKDLPPVGVLDNKRHCQIDSVATPRRVGAVEVKLIDGHPGNEIVALWRDPLITLQGFDGSKMRTQGFDERVWQTVQRP